MCSYCGNIIEEQTLDDREYRCSNCGLSMDRDDNAAINVLNAGFKKIFNNFIIAKPKKVRHKKGKIPTDSGECMPVEGKPIPGKASFSVEAGSPDL